MANRLDILSRVADDEALIQSTIVEFDQNTEAFAMTANVSLVVRHMPALGWEPTLVRILASGGCAGLCCRSLRPPE